MIERTSKADDFIQQLREQAASYTDKRTGQNTQYEIADIVMAAFSIFFIQAPSFLSGQEKMELLRQKNNARSLFNVEQIPSDTQIRKLLDEINPEEIYPFFGTMISYLEKTKHLDEFRSYKRNLLIAVDGTIYHSSKNICCTQCNTREKDGKIDYFHGVVTPTIVKSGKKQNQVVVLYPEFIMPQDGHEKQDCEREAIKRWLEKYGQEYGEKGATILGDDLYSCEPICRKILEKQLDFILTCKESSHPQMYQTLTFLDNIGKIKKISERFWTGKQGEIHIYRFVNDIPIRGVINKTDEPLLVNWCEIIVRDEKSAEVLFHNAYITNFEINEENVPQIVQDGRSRWAIENGNYNVLKKHGYHGEHNFGHGDKYLSSSLFTLNLIAFLIHTVCEITDEPYRTVRNKIRKRMDFYIEIFVLTGYLYFTSWGQLLSFMIDSEHENIPASKFL